MRCPTARPTARRGLTLVELLVTIALMLLIMSIIVTLFTAATEGMSIARTDQELSSVTRRIDAVFRQDLRGATARFTPPLDPNDNLGYFEMGENSFADPQGEDTDDYLAFTAKAPPGQPFTGRIMVRRGNWPDPITGQGAVRAGQPRFAPVTITSDYAEILYFWRNGNLYRRVLLIVPDRKDTLAVDLNPATGTYRYPGGAFDLDGDNVPDSSWQGVNDISVRPPATTAATPFGAPIPNTLGDLTNRHNRAFRPRFSDDYFTRNPATGAFSAGPDAQFDDVDQDGAPDYYPTLTFGAMNNPNGNLMIGDVNHPAITGAIPLTADRAPFPFLFPGAYSKPVPFSGPPGNPGSINLGPYLSMPNPASPFLPVLTNHSPLDLADNLPVPTAAASQWTWWGFPTSAETRSPFWNAPTKRVNYNDFGLGAGFQAYGLSRLRTDPTYGFEWLPPQDHWYTDGVGNPTLILPNTATLQDDLLASNVRSFDLKVLDPFYSDYGFHANLGEENSTTARVTPQPAGGRYEPPRYDDLGYAARFKRPIGTNSTTFNGEVTFGTLPIEQRTFGHEGRIPPLVIDNRFDPQAISYMPPADWPTLAQLGDNSPTTVRMRRVWDSWSTDYSQAPLSGIDPARSGPYADTVLGFSTRPLYPSYPPPYPSQLRGIQIQIRLAAPDGSRPKVLTIRQDFTDKL